jgi:uncharacterized protein (DUF885 family)
LKSYDGSGSLECAIGIANDAWAELQRTIFVQQQRGEPLTKIPDVTYAEAQRRSKVGQSLLDRLGRLRVDGLPHEFILTLRLVRFRAVTWAKEADFYWHVIDPLGNGFFGMFLPSAYCGGFLLNYVHRQLSSTALKDESDCQGYRAIIRDYALLIDGFTERTAGQADRGIRMPKLQILAARRLVRSLSERAVENLGAAPRRLGGGFEQNITQLIAETVAPAFSRLLQTLSESYYRRAPEGVGMGQ